MEDASSSMSILSLVTNAGPVVQLVMLVLLLASMISWYMIVSRFRVLGRARRADHAFEEKFWSGEDLSSLYNQVRKKPNPDSASEAIFRAGFQEFVRLSKSTRGSEAIMEGAQRAMRVALQREESRLTKHLPFLATVGSTSPYIGLFGTVWGIMNSFPRPGQRDPGDAQRGGAGHRRGAGGHRHGPVRGDSRGNGLQPVCGAVRIPGG